MIYYENAASTFRNHASGDSCIETALELREQLQDLIVGERQELRHDRAGHALVRIEPEVGVEQSGPSEAPRAASSRAAFGVDVERQSPFLGHAGEQVRVVR